jgi:hypothetical protein
MFPILGNAFDFGIAKVVNLAKPIVKEEQRLKLEFG